MPINNKRIMPVRNMLTKNAFRKWLESKPDGTFVGRSYSSHHNPISTYMSEMYPGYIFSVSGNGIWYWNMEGNAFTFRKSWVMMYIIILDARHNISIDIPVFEALEVLDKV